jgi:glutaredoxin
MNSKHLLYIGIVVILVLAGAYGIFKSVTSPGKYDDFAKCLTSKNIAMYGTDWCSHCKEQKILFGKSFKYVDYVNCDTRRGDCTDVGVTGYPTWIINGESYSGKQSMSTLSSLSGCNLRG